MGVHPHNSPPLTCSLEVVPHEQQLRNGRAKEHCMLTLGSPTGVILNKVCCKNGALWVMTHANYQLEQKQEHNAPLGYLWAEVLCPITLSDHWQNYIPNPDVPAGKPPVLMVDYFCPPLIFNLNVFTGHLFSCCRASIILLLQQFCLSPVIYLESNPICSLPTFGQAKQARLLSFFLFDRFSVSPRPFLHLFIWVYHL